MKFAAMLKTIEGLTRDAADAMVRRIRGAGPMTRDTVTGTHWMLGADAWPAPAPVRVTARTRGAR